MSRQNVETVRRVFGPYPDSFFDLFADDVEIDASAYPLPDLPNVVHGRQAAADFWLRYFSTWDEYFAAAEEVIAAQDDVLVVVIHERGRGRGSGVPLERRTASVWTMRHGRLIRWQAFADRKQALQAVGLGE